MEAREIFSQAIGVVGDLALPARNGEKAPARVAESCARTAHPNHAGELRAVEEIELRRGIRAERFVQERFVGAGRRDRLPCGSKTGEFRIKDRAADPALARELDALAGQTLEEL